MKIIHLSDLHLGKRLNEYSLLEDQAYILDEICRIVREEAPDAVLLAGDIYDKSIPPAEAVQLFDDFIVRLAHGGTQIFVISGNHDSPERLAFGSRLMDESGVHFSPVYEGATEPLTLTDAYGPVHFWLLPFIRPVHMRRWVEEDEKESIVTYADAVREAVRRMNVDFTERNVLVTHQFVTGSRRSESEEIQVGGTDNVDASVFDGFDYTALGHIHSPQNCTPCIRYCGTPLKYSFSEAKDEKSVTVVTLAGKGSLQVRTVPLTPRRDMKELRGSFAGFMNEGFYKGADFCSDYLHITLTDEEEIPEAAARLREIYKGLMKLDYDNTRTRRSREIEGPDEVEHRQPLDIFAEFYEQQNNQPMSEVQRSYMEKLIGELEEEA